MKIIFSICTVLALTLSRLAYAQDEGIVFRDDFNNLENWKPFYFPNIKAHSKYEISKDGNNKFLTARSQASASGLICKISFDPHKYPVLRWRWKVDNVYKDADPKSKEGDDYPLRIYVTFEYDSGTANLARRLEFGLVKELYGSYPPMSSLTYVWSSRQMNNTFFDNPYTSQAKMFLLRSDEGQLGIWLDEEVNILSDYRKAFAEPTPKRAFLAIMNDSDNTGESAVGHLDFIELSRDEQNEDRQDK
jgi:hypothetical protein